MKVLYFSESYCGHDHRFVTTIAEDGHEVYYARLFNTPVDLKPLRSFAGIHLVEIKGIDKDISPIQFMRFAFRFRKLVKKIAPDVIHAGPVDKCASIAAFSGRTPLVAMSWGYDLMKDTKVSWIWRHLARYALKHAHQFTSDALATKQEALALGAREEHCTTFPWGVDIKHFSKTDRDLGAESTITFFCNRSWESNYGVDVLSKAFVLSVRENPNLRLLLLGNGSKEAEIRSIFHSAEALNKVEFAGRISQADLPEYYHRADVYVTPSHVDGTSVSLMEGMACGLPIIASDIPGNVDWVIEGEHGWLFHDNDVEGLAKKLLVAATARERLNVYGSNCRKTAEQRADWEKNKLVLLKTYDGAIAVRNGK